jgi:hypothetical protein
MLKNNRLKLTMRKLRPISKKIRLRNWLKLVRLPLKRPFLP